MLFQENISLKGLNTFGINVFARYFLNFSNVDELKNALEEASGTKSNILILGEGSNILFTKDFEGIVLKNACKGIALVSEDNEAYYIKSGAGEIWHDLVLFCINNNFGGIENLSLIPGTVGAGPIQNIGAYGVELKDFFWELEALNIQTTRLEVFNKEKCKFGYRDSIFKNENKGTHIITSVTLKLPKQNKLNTSYGAIEAELAKQHIKNPTIRDVSNAVINIRQRKLPNPKEIGNAGSFFKNPVISNEKFMQLLNQYPHMVGYPSGSEETKVAAGWLIEKCGWKGKTLGNYGVHKFQSLVLVNYGGATGKEIYNLSEDIKDSVLQKFNIELQREVWVI